MNRLWTKEDMFAKREIIIPTTEENYLQYKSQQSLSQSPVQDAKLEELIDQFISSTELRDREFANFLLRENSFNLTKAILAYENQIKTNPFAKETIPENSFLDDEIKEVIRVEKKNKKDDWQDFSWDEGEEIL